MPGDTGLLALGPLGVRHVMGDGLEEHRHVTRSRRFCRIGLALVAGLIAVTCTLSTGAFAVSAGDSGQTSTAPPTRSSDEWCC